jgi:hypothetical protein
MAADFHPDDVTALAPFVRRFSEVFGQIMDEAMMELNPRQVTALCRAGERMFAELTRTIEDDIAGIDAEIDRFLDDGPA